MPSTASHGVFTSARALRSASAGDISKLYFRSDNQVQFDGRQLSQVDRSDSLYHVLEMGHKDTKYLKKKLRSAPGMDRSSSRYCTEFWAKPLAEREYNRGFADSFRKINGEGTRMLAPSMSTGTLYNETFACHSSEKIKDAKPEVQGSSQSSTNTLSSSGINYVTVSQMQREHSGKVQTPRGKERRPSHLMLSSGVVGDAYKTTYSREFTSAAADLSGRGYFSSLEPEPRLLPAHVVPNPATDEIFRASRSVLFAPGR